MELGLIQRRLRSFFYSGLGILLAGAAGFAQAQGVLVAGQLTSVSGECWIERAQAKVSVQKDTSFMVGDVLYTGKTGVAQLRLTDGTEIVLRPDTEFRLDQYRFTGPSDKAVNAVVTVLKGSVRAVTGLIGRANRDNFKVNAVVATLGIRGAELDIGAGPGLSPERSNKDSFEPEEIWTCIPSPKCPAN